MIDSQSAGTNSPCGPTVFTLPSLPEILPAIILYTKKFFIKPSGSEAKKSEFSCSDLSNLAFAGGVVGVRPPVERRVMGWEFGR